MGAKRRPAAVRRWIGRRWGGGGFGAYLGDVKAQVSIGGRHEGRPLVGLDFEAPECHGRSRGVVSEAAAASKNGDTGPRKASSAGAQAAVGRRAGTEWAHEASFFQPDTREAHPPSRHRPGRWLHCERSRARSRRRGRSERDPRWRRASLASAARALQRPSTRPPPVVSDASSRALSPALSDRWRRPRARAAASRRSHPRATAPTRSPPASRTLTRSRCVLPSPRPSPPAPVGTP